ncbi:amidohydrolase family protein [Streptosporangium algeriense]|uniref:Amidohydrolase family protein n=1 Tax=Streptosporangium algeriense TaxID=1682748 RepID=A0ABW3DN74_9ACTN
MSSPFHADGCEVTAERFGENAFLVTVDGPRGEQVLLKAPGWRHTKLTDLVAKRHLTWDDGQVLIDIPAGRPAWLMVFDPPPQVSIFDFDPDPVLLTPRSPVERARFPVVDIHAHLCLASQTAAERVALMDELNISLVVTSAFAERKETTADSARRFSDVAPGRFRAAATVDWSLASRPGGAALMAGRLASDVAEHGAVLVGEMHDKGFGVDDPGAGPVPEDPMYLDDPRLDEFWAAASDLGTPVIMHCGDDIAFYRPWDERNEALRRLYLAPWSRRRSGGLSHEEIHDRRDRLLTRFPRLTVIAAHLDGCAERLDLVEERLRRHPNLHLELGARHRTLARQPRHAARFLERWAGRVLFGGDKVQDRTAYTEQFRVLESDDDAFRPAGHVEPWPLYGLGLPDEVLRALYSETALRLIPALSRHTA